MTITRVRVLVHMPHLLQYGLSPFKELTYSADFPVSENDVVACPPSGKSTRWMAGIVTSVGDPTGYTGQTKFIRRRIPVR